MRHSSLFGLNPLFWSPGPAINEIGSVGISGIVEVLISVLDVSVLDRLTALEVTRSEMEKKKRELSASILA